MAADTYVQTDRPLKLTTPLGKDALLLIGFLGREALSEPFSFQLHVQADNKTDVAFDKLLGQAATVELALPKGKKRFFNGIVSKVTEGKRDTTFTAYTLELVPKLWVLGQTFQSRIFQHLTVPDILKKVLAGLDVKYELQGIYHPRHYCVQYRETDLAFASRLMEEEGIFYFFKHTEKGHTLVVADSAQSHADVPEFSKITFEEVKGGTREDLRINEWSKTQELRSGKYSLWDHCFEMPQKHLEAEATIQDSVQAGKVTHKLKVGGNEQWEVYDYPGSFAQRFDGIDKGGSAKPAELQKIFEDDKRTVGLRMQEEAVRSLLIRGSSNCGQLLAGHKFTLERHYHADGAYVLTSVQHSANLPASYRSGDGGGLTYQNKFTCIPLALPYRPPLATPKPVIAGTQTAHVVGPAGEEIFCDKYGRVKVQMHWDRHGKKNADSSCWVRVSQGWGGGKWGGMNLPHVGQEVIVSFVEGDVDRPLITGRVYNADQMPPLSLPGHRTKSIIRDHGGNQICMEGGGAGQSMILHSPVSATTFSMGARAPSLAPKGSGAGGGESDAVEAGPPAIHPLAPVLYMDGSFTLPSQESTSPDLQACGTGSGSGGGPTPPPGTHPGQPALQPNGDYKIPNWNTKFPDPTVHKDGSITLPEGQIPDGFWGQTAGCMTWMVSGHVHWDVNVHETKCIHGYKESLILGHKADITIGYERKHVFGTTFTTLVGLKTEINLAGQLNKLFGFKNDFIFGSESKEVLGPSTTLIAGFKTEVIGGYSTSILAGTKTEIIKGTTYKLQAGAAKEWKATSMNTKQPSLKDMIGTARKIAKSSEEMIEGAKKIKTSAKLIEEADKIDVKASAEAAWKAANMRWKADALQFDGEVLIDKCGSYDAKADKYTVNNGAFTVK